MGDTTKIEWTHSSFNPWLGCQRVSPACGRSDGGGCYAEVSTPVRVHRAKGLELWGPPKTTARHRTSVVNWRGPARWNREAAKAGVRRRVFVSSLSDIFEDHPQVAPWRVEALALLGRCTMLDVQLLTKRPENIRRMVPEAWLRPGAWPDHIWVGCTVEDQKRANERIPELLKVPARVRFLSMEPLLEPVNLARWFTHRSDGEILCDECCWKDRECDSSWHCSRNNCAVCRGTGAIPKLAWIIIGGESGPNHRTLDLDAVRSLVEQCRQADVPVFVKQDSGARSGTKGRIPDDLWIKEFPR